MTTTTTTEPSLPSGFALFGPSWRVLLRNLFTFFYLPVMPIIVAMCAGVIGLSTIHSPAHIFFAAVALLALAAAVVLFLVALPAMTYAQLRSAQGILLGYTDALNAGRQYFWRLWGVRIATSVAVVVGLILLIVPGFFMMRRYLLAPYFLIEEDLGVFEAMRRSAAISKQYWRATWGVVGVQLLIDAVSMVPFVGNLTGGIMSIAYYCAPAVRFVQIAELERVHKPQESSGGESKKRGDKAKKPQARARGKTVKKSS